MTVRAQILLWLVALVALAPGRSCAADAPAKPPAPAAKAQAQAQAPAQTQAQAEARPPAAVPALFGLTNLWRIHLVVSPADWKTLASRSGGQQRGPGYVGGNGQPGLVEGIVRGIFGGDGPPQGRQGGGARPPEPADGGSRYPWAHCTVEAAGQVLTNVSIRFKGVSSVVRAPNAFKRPFKLDFDRDADGRRFQGVGEVYLNNNVNDATQMREALAYELFRRAGIAAPRTAFAQVTLTIPGRLEKANLGLYTLVEPVGGEFLKRSFGTKKGLLLKPEMMRGLAYLGDDWDNYRERYHPKDDPTPEEADEFIRFVRIPYQSGPDTLATDLGRHLDPTLFARFVALNAILANVDSFIGNGHNYFMHVHPATHRVTFVPWDLNESFGMHPVSGASGDQMRTSVLRPNADPNRLVERFVADPVLGPVYRAQCAWLMTNVFIPSRINADIDRIAAVTKPVVMAESRRAREDFQRTVLETMRPDEGDLRQPRADAEFAKEPYRPWGFPDAVEIDNIPLKRWVAGRHAQVTGELEGRLRGTKPRPRLWQQ